MSARAARLAVHGEIARSSPCSSMPWVSQVRSASKYFFKGSVARSGCPTVTAVDLAISCVGIGTTMMLSEDRCVGTSGVGLVRGVLVRAPGSRPGRMAGRSLIVEQ